MKRYREIIDEWDSCISIYPKIKLQDAKKMYIEMSNCSDKQERNKIRTELIQGTLYVVLGYIKNNGLVYLNSGAYDLSDIINVCNEIWINKIDSGELMKVENFSSLFKGDFYNKLSEKLNITKNIGFENTPLDLELFVDLLNEYINLRKEHLDFNRDDLIEYIISNPKYKNLNYLIPHSRDTQFCKLFDAIIGSFEVCVDDLHLSRTNMRKLIYILINNGLEYLGEDINKVYFEDPTDVYLSEYSRNKIADIVLNSNEFDDTLKEVIIKRFGFEDGECKSLGEIAQEQGVPRERVRQREALILRKLRKKDFTQKLKKYM